LRARKQPQLRRRLLLPNEAPRRRQLDCSARDCGRLTPLLQAVTGSTAPAKAKAAAAKSKAPAKKAPAKSTTASGRKKVGWLWMLIRRLTHHNSPAYHQEVISYPRLTFLFVRRRTALRIYFDLCRPSLYSSCR
jgi:hypothetical protein